MIYFKISQLLFSLVFTSQLHLSMVYGGTQLAHDNHLVEKRFGRCSPCPEDNDFNTIAGDSRCNLTISNSFDDGNGCPSCGCQRCPDLKYYLNSVTDYCSATPFDHCGDYPHCLQNCLGDGRCQVLDFDVELDPGKGTCGCKCQQCPDGKLYFEFFDYKKLQPLTEDQIKKCPHVLYPVSPAQDLSHARLEECANCLQMIINCSSNGKAGDSRCKFYPSTTILIGCPACDCQKCPHLKLYNNNVKNYCTAQSTTCNRLLLACSITCAKDTRCNNLPFNGDKAGCQCSCQSCPDGNIYGPTNDFKLIQPLSKQSVAQCSHVLHPPLSPRN